MRITEIDINATTINLGRQGEHLVQQIRFPIDQIVKRHGYHGEFSLIARRQGESALYPVRITADDHYVYWTVTSIDTAFPGFGKCELQYFVHEKMVFSSAYRTNVTAVNEDPYYDAVPIYPPTSKIPYRPKLGPSPHYPAIHGEDHERIDYRPAPPPRPHHKHDHGVEQAVYDADKYADWAKEAGETAVEAAQYAHDYQKGAEKFSHDAYEAAKAAQQAATSMSFVSFDITPDGDAVIHRAEQLGTTSFGFTDDGYLEVSF